MEIKFKAIVFSFFCLLVIMGYTLFNIFAFMSVEKTCEDDFELINRCGCVPCDNSLRQVFNKPDLCSNYTSELNLSKISNNDG